MLVLILLTLMHIVIHEIGHVVAAYAAGSKVKKIGFSRKGLYIVRSPAATPLLNALVSFGGPAINIMTGLLFLAYYVPHAPLPMYIGFFNLLPFPESDGVHIWKALRGELPCHARI